jgi:cysteine desulfurase/selenocysteine lyase
VTHGPPDSIGNGLVNKASAVRNGLRSFSDLRQDFPILARESASGAPLVYLDNAASTQRPDAVLEAMDDCYRRFYSNVHRGIHTLSEESTEHF